MYGIGLSSLVPMLDDVHRAAGIVGPAYGASTPPSETLVTNGINIELIADYVFSLRTPDGFEVDNWNGPFTCSSWADTSEVEKIFDVPSSPFAKSTLSHLKRPCTFTPYGPTIRMESKAVGTGASP